MGLVSSRCCERTPEDKTYDIYLARGRVNGKAYVVGQRKLGLGRDLG